MSDHEMEIGELTPEDLDRIAAYLEGTASDVERKQVESLLLRSEAAREALAEAAALLGLDEDEASDADAPEGPPASSEVRASARWRWLAPLAAAAAAVWLFWPPPSEGFDAWVVALSASPRPGAYSFPVVRGETGPPDAMGVRAGVRWLDLRVAAAAGDAPEADSLLRVLVEELRGQPGSGALVSRLGALPLAREPIGSTEAALVEFLGPAFESGVALESMRLALARDDRTLVRALLEDARFHEHLAAGLAAVPGADAVLDRTRAGDADSMDLGELARLIEEALVTALGP